MKVTVLPKTTASVDVGLADDLSRPNSRRKVAHIAQGDRRLPPPFIPVFDLLRRLVPPAGLVELKFQSLQSRFRNKVRMR
jgi:hypothetical protein